MRTASMLVVGTPGHTRPHLLLTMAATSLARERTLDVRLRHRRLARVTIPTGGAHKLVRVSIPAGRGVARLQLRARPMAESAKVVNPADSRKLSISVADVRITP